MLRRSSAELHHLLTILRATVTQGTTGQPVKTWTTLDTIWGEIVPQLQAEVMEEKQIQALGLYLVTIRYYQGNGAPLLPTDRLVWNGNTLSIVSDLIEDGRQFWQQFTCKSVP